MGIIASMFVPLIAGYIIWWILSNLFSIAQLGWKGTITVILISYILFWLFTNNDSPGKIVPVIDSGYSDVKGQVSQTTLAQDFANILKPVGVDSATLGLQAGANAQLPETIDLGNNSYNNQSTFTQTQQSTGFPVHVNVAFAQTIRVKNASTGEEGDGQANPGTMCVSGWVDPYWMIGCEGLAGFYVQPAAWMSGIPAYAGAVQSVAQQQQAVPLSNAQLGACWQVFAGKYLIGETAYGGQALPVGTQWTLTGPGEYGSLASKNSEEWTLSNPDLGITNYPINGHLGRSFPGADDSGSVLVYGQNVEMAPACQAAQ